MLQFFIAVLYMVTMCNLSTADDSDPVSYRIIEHQNPQRYTLDLEFRNEVFQGISTYFNGSLRIDFLVARSINTIQFHAPLTLISKTFLENETRSVPVESEIYDPVTEIYTITTRDKLNYTYNYTLNLQYSGKINTNEMKGVFINSYTDEDGVLQHFLATHFQPVYARRVFPCFDEPKMKATFVISIIYPKGLTAISNAAQNGTVEEIDDDYERVTFQETPVMSTYLVGFVLSKLTCSQGSNLTNEIPYRVCSRSKFANERSVALEMGPPFLKELENITALNYSDQLLGKLDQIAIPGYKSRYMENWGMITYRESSLLMNTEETSIAYRNVLMNMFLELSHSWFGNLESALWWDYLHLNQGLSRYFQYYAAAQIETFKKWRLEEQFAIDQLQPSFVTDALSSSLPLSYPVESPNEILTKYNSFSYSKGASIIRMAQHIIGPEDFLKGVKYFLPIYSGSNIMPAYLWNKLEVFIPRELLPKTENLKGAMENWTEKPGFPLVTASIHGNNIILSQQRFLYSGKSDFVEWCVPITYTLSGDYEKFLNTTTKVWLTPANSVTVHDVMEENDWIVINNQQVGYYRVNYDDTLWQKIKNLFQTNHTVVHVNNRAQIVDDLMNIARAKVLNYSYAFDILQYLKNENEYIPWYSAISNFNYLIGQLGETSVLGSKLSSMVLNLLENVYYNISFVDIDPDDQVYLLKLLTLSQAACKLGQDSCVSTAKELFASYKSGASLDKNLHNFVFCNGLRYSEDIAADWNFLWGIFLKETIVSKREILIRAFGCTKNNEYLKTYLDLAMNSSLGISFDEFPLVWSAIYSSNSEGVDTAFDYLYENHTKLSEYYPSAATLLTSVIERFNRNDQLTKLEALITSERLEPSVRVTALTALKAAKERFDWVTSIEDDLLVYLDVPDSTTEYTSTTTGGVLTIKSLFKLLVAALLLKLFL